MEKKINILKEFFENPDRGFHIRELSRILKTNHTKVRNHLNKLVKEEYLIKKEGRVYSIYKLKINKKTLNLKLFYNLEKLRKSNLIKDLEDFYDLPTIVLFGSYSKANDDKNSDIDVFVITKSKKKFDTKKYEKYLKREIQIFMHNKKDMKNLKKNSKELINNVLNGIVLSGQVEIL